MAEAKATLQIKADSVEAAKKEIVSAGMTYFHGVPCGNIYISQIWGTEEQFKKLENASLPG